MKRHTTLRIEQTKKSTTDASQETKTTSKMERTYDAQADPDEINGDLRAEITDAIKNLNDVNGPITTIILTTYETA